MDRQMITHTASVLGLAELTAQEAIFLQTLLRGLPLIMAAQQAGVPQEQAHSFVSQPHVAQVLAYMREQQITAEVEINKNMLNLMTLEAHAKSANATEELKAIDQLAKLNGLYPDKTIKHEINDTRKTAQQMRRMSDDDLAQLAGEDIIDAEFTEVNDNDDSERESESEENSENTV